MERIPALKEQIGKFFFEKHLEFLTSVPQRRIQEIILSSCARGNSGKLTDYAEVFPTHRTTYGHFLSKGKWDEEEVAKVQKQESFRTIMELPESHHTPVFVSFGTPLRRASQQNSSCCCVTLLPQKRLWTIQSASRLPLLGFFLGR